MTAQTLQHFLHIYKKPPQIFFSSTVCVPPHAPRTFPYVAVQFFDVICKRGETAVALNRIVNVSRVESLPNLFFDRFFSSCVSTGMHTDYTGKGKKKKSSELYLK